MINERHDLRAGLAELSGGERSGDHKCGGRAASKADVRRDTVGVFEQRNVVEQQAHHSLSFTIGRVRILPQSREVGGECENTRPGFGIDCEAIRLTVALRGRVRVGDQIRGRVG